MIETFNNFFDKKKLLQLNSVFDQGTWEDGSISGPSDKQIKHNLQQTDKTVRQMVNVEVHRMLREFSGFYLISKASEVLMLKYNEGMHYNDHVDFIHMYGIRTDYTCVMNLNDDFEGGEHYTKDMHGNKTLHELKPGDLIMYDTNQIHGVNPITKGERRCITFWMESAIQDASMREPIVRFNKLYQRLYDKNQLDDEDILELDWFRMAMMRNNTHFRD